MSCGSYTGLFNDAIVSATPEELACRGSSPQYQGSAWFQYWSQNNSTFCSSVFANILYGSTQNGIRKYDSTQIRRIKNNLNNAFATYTTLYPITNPTDPNFNVFQQTLINTCILNPGFCTDFIVPYCSNCTREQIASNPLYLSLCGCNSQNGVPPEYQLSNISCDGLCNRINTVHNIDEQFGTVKNCNVDTCIIDNISITATQSVVQNNITFSQMCSSCKDNCDCIISGTNLNGTLQTVGLSSPITFNTACGVNSRCLTNDVNGILTQVPCPRSATFSTTTDSVNINTTIIWVIIIIGIILVISIICIYGFNKK
jgi:hypothetical protein